MLLQGRQATTVFILALVALNLVLFLPSMRGDFIWDDHYFIGSSPLITNPHFLRDFLKTPYGGYSGTDPQSREMDRSVQFYRPLTSLSFWFDCKIWGMNPAGFHLTNILLQTLNVILLYFVLCALGFDSVPAFFAGLLFSVFPPHFENVAWISGRTDLLAFFFAAASSLLFVRYINSKRTTSLTASSLAFLLSLLSKESGIALVLVFFIVLLWKVEKLRRAILPMTPFLAISAAWLLLRWSALGGQPGQSAGRTVPEILAVLGFYGFRTLFPFDMSVTIDALPVFRNGFYIFLGAGMMIFSILALFFIIRRGPRDKTPWLVWSAFFLLLLPSFFVLVSSGVISLVAWRFLYFSSAVFCSAAAFWLWTSFRKKWVPAVLVVLLTAAFAVEASPKIRLFGGSETDFWLGIRSIDREDGIARIAIATRLLASDEVKALRAFDQVLAEKGHPLYGIWQQRVYEVLARHFTEKGDYETAGRYFRELFRVQPFPEPAACFTYADYLSRTGRAVEAEKLVQGMLLRQPENHAILVQAARYYIFRKNFERAQDYLRKDYELFRSPETLALLDAITRETAK